MVDQLRDRQRHIQAVIRDAQATLEQLDSESLLVAVDALAGDDAANQRLDELEHRRYEAQRAVRVGVLAEQRVTEELTQAERAEAEAHLAGALAEHQRQARRRQTAVDALHMALADAIAAIITARLVSKAEQAAADRVTVLARQAGHVVNTDNPEVLVIDGERHSRGTAPLNRRPLWRQVLASVIFDVPDMLLHTSDAERSPADLIAGYFAYSGNASRYPDGFGDLVAASLARLAERTSAPQPAPATGGRRR